MTGALFETAFTQLSAAREPNCQDLRPDRPSGWRTQLFLRFAQNGIGAAQPTAPRGPCRRGGPCTITLGAPAVLSWQGAWPVDLHGFGVSAGHLQGGAKADFAWKSWLFNETLTISGSRNHEVRFYGLNSPGRGGSSRCLPSCGLQFGHLGRTISLWHAIWHEFDRRFFLYLPCGHPVSTSAVSKPSLGVAHVSAIWSSPNFTPSWGSTPRKYRALRPIGEIRFDPVLGRS